MTLPGPCCRQGEFIRIGRPRRATTDREVHIARALLDLTHRPMDFDPLELRTT
ncbi:hypothetical protein IPZ68_29640 [Streptomyces arenae]|nr:hypothetical protein [Streptomyces arenae]